MEIKLSYYDLCSALEDYINKKGGKFDLTNKYAELMVEITTQTYTEKKHKNGRIVKNEHGYPVWESTGTETNHHGFGECDEISVYIE